MMPIALLMSLCLQAPPAPPPQAPAAPVRDTIVLRDGRKVEGTYVEYERFVEMQGADGRKQRFPSWEVVRTDLAPDFIRVPEVVPFPLPILGAKTDYTLLSWKSTLLSIAKGPGQKMVAVDIATLNKLWEMDKPLTLVQEPFLVQNVLYLITLEKDTDPSKKIKVKDNTLPKPVQKLTYKALDLESCQTLWTESFDNADRNKMVWEISPQPPPSLHVLPDKIMFRFVREGWPVDAGVVDKEKAQKVSIFVSYDPERKKVLTTLESRDAGEFGGKPFYLPDVVILQVFQRVGVFRFASIDARNGKLKWETDWIVGKLHEVTDESIFVSDTKFFYSLLTKTGKKNEKWSVELLGGSIVDLDASHAYLYRKSGPPKLIQGIDLKNGSDAFRIEMGPADDLTHVARIGHRIVYYDSAKHLYGYDTLAKKGIWKWQTLGQTIPGAPKMLGPGLSVYKDGRVTLLDPSNGTPVWEVRGTYISVNQIGSEGVLANKLAGSDLVRRRREAAGEGVFLTSTRTPIRFSLGVTDAFSVPSVADGVAYTLSSSGWLVACNVKEGKLLWHERVSRTPLNPLCPPFALGDRVAVHLNGETHVLDLANKGQVYKTPHQPLRPDLHLEMLGTAFPSTGRGRPFGLVEFATGKRLWDAPLQGVTTYALGDGKVYAATASSIVRMDAKTGAVEETQAQARGVTGLAWDGKRLVAATGPYGFGFFAPAEEFKAVFRAKEQNPALVQKFRGWIVAPGGDVVYSNADGEVSCFEGGEPDKVAWSFKTPFFTSPLLAHEGKIWLASQQQGLFGLDQKSGRIVWKREKVDAADYTPILWEGKPAFWSAEGWVLPTE